MSEPWDPPRSVDEIVSRHMEYANCDSGADQHSCATCGEHLCGRLDVWTCLDGWLRCGRCANGI